MLDLLKTAPWHKLNQFRGQTSDSRGGAPQVFYFEPHKLWYLIYQTKDFNRQPIYSTTATIDKPESWRGTVWAPTEKMVIQGLENYGYDGLTREIAMNHLACVVDVYKESGTI